MSFLLVDSQEITIKVLNQWSALAYANEKAFLEKFASNWAEELHGLSWTGERMYFSVLVKSGATVMDAAPIDEWLRFYNQHKTQNVKTLEVSGNAQG